MEVETRLKQYKNTALSKEEVRAVDIEVEKRIKTDIIDGELIEGNRLIAKKLQEIFLENPSNINLKNVKTISSTIKDIESIANPKPETYINNSNQSITITESFEDFYK